MSADFFTGLRPRGQYENLSHLALETPLISLPSKTTIKYLPFVLPKDEDDAEVTNAKVCPVHNYAQLMSLNSHLCKGNKTIGKLPVEILMEIFKDVVSFERYTFSGRTITSAYQISPLRRNSFQDHPHLRLIWDKTKAPFNLLQVCSSWRSMVQSISSLWRALSGLSLSTLPYRPTVPEMGYWLKHSGSAPLCLHLALDPSFNPGSFHQKDLLRLYSTQAHRWESLCLDLNVQLCRDLNDIFRKNIDDHGFPCLSRIELSFDPICCPNKHDFDELLSSISSINTLRKILLYYRPLSPYYSEYLNLQWSHLHVVYIDIPLEAHIAVHCISQCIIATDITFRRLDQEHRTLVKAYHCLPNLEHLDLHGVYAFEVLDSFCLPALDTLRIQAIHLRVETYEKLNNFLTRSNSRLKQLTVEELFYHQPCLANIVKAHFSIPLLRSFPTVELCHANIHECLLEMLQDTPVQTLPPLLAWNGDRGMRAVGWKEFTKYDTPQYSWINNELNLF